MNRKNLIALVLCIVLTAMGMNLAFAELASSQVAFNYDQPSSQVAFHYDNAPSSQVAFSSGASMSDLGDESLSLAWLCGLAGIAVIGVILAHRKRVNER